MFAVELSTGKGRLILKDFIVAGEEDTGLGIKTYRFPLGLTDGKVFQQLSEGEYFYGTPLQGLDSC